MTLVRSVITCSRTAGDHEDLLNFLPEEDRRRLFFQACDVSVPEDRAEFVGYRSNCNRIFFISPDTDFASLMSFYGVPLVFSWSVSSQEYLSEGDFSMKRC